MRAMTGGTGYAQRHLKRNDYYHEHRKVQGEWQGRGAELLGLRGNVTHELAEIATEEVREQQEARLAPNERHTLVNLRLDSQEQTPRILHEPSRAAESLQYAKKASL